VKQANRWQIEKGKLRARQRELRRLLKNAVEYEKQGILVLLNENRDSLRGLNRAENARKRRGTRRKNVEKFLRNTCGYFKQLFEQSKGGELTATKTEVEQHRKVCIVAQRLSRKRW